MCFLDIITSSIYGEVGSFFSISHKVDLYITRSLNQSVKPLININSNENSLQFVNLIVSTNKSIVSVEVKGPDYNRKDKIINWGLWLPYREIVDSSDQIIPYIKCYFDGVVIVFNDYGVEEGILRKVQMNVESEILGNPEYEYNDEDTPELDLSDLDLD